MVFGKWCDSRQLIVERQFLRKKIFSMEMDMPEDNTLLALHIVLFERDKPIGIGSISLVSNTATIYGVGVIEEKQKLGYADLIMRMLLQKAFLSGAEQVLCYAPDKTVSFFQKFNFYPTEKKDPGQSWQMLVCREAIDCPCHSKRFY